MKIAEELNDEVVKNITSNNKTIKEIAVQ